MKIKISLLSVIIIAVLLFAGCNRGTKQSHGVIAAETQVPESAEELEEAQKDTIVEIPLEKKKNVFVLGSDGEDYNFLWKNGELIQTSVMKIGFSSVFASGNDVFVAGSAFAMEGGAYLWKNGEFQVLEQENNTGTRAASVFVSGNDVYVAGWKSEYSEERANLPQYAVLWKNGKAQTLGNGIANFVCVLNNDVYVLGADNDTIILWKNGTAQNLGKGRPARLYISGNDVYAVGWVNNDIILWKNGVAENKGRERGTSVFIYGSDVYEAGMIADNAVIWKNGEHQLLGEGYALSIYVSGGDVYAAGQFNKGEYYGATLWKNGVVQEGYDGYSAHFVMVSD